MGFPGLHSRKENWTAEGQRNYEGCTFISLACYTSEFSRGGEGILFNYGIRMVAEDRIKIEV